MKRSLSDVNRIDLFCLAIAGVLLYFDQAGVALLMWPIYMVWRTCHNIELKLNALLNEKGIQIDID